MTPLNKNQLQAAILKAFEDQQDNPEGSAENVASQIANAIEGYIVGRGVTINPGIPVSTAGTAAAQTGTTTGTGTGQIN